MNYYTGFQAGYNMDDFEKNVITIYKHFECNGFYFSIFYTTNHERRLIITVRKGMSKKISYTINTLLFENCNCDLISMVCKDIIARVS